MAEPITPTASLWPRASPLSVKCSPERTTRTSNKLSKKLAEGYRTILKKAGLEAYVAQAGVNGALMLYPQEIRNYRDWTKIDVDLWRQFWFAMVNRGVLAMPYWWDEQWTVSVQHTEADIDKHLSVFEESCAQPWHKPKKSAG